MNLDHLDGIHIYMLSLAVCGVVGSIALFSILFVPGCEVPPSSPDTAGPVETDPELPGTIVCYEPWNRPETNGNYTAEEVYRDTIGGWVHNMHTTHGGRARTAQGFVMRDGLFVAYVDGTGNMVYLVNYPCRITMPISE